MSSEVATGTRPSSSSAAWSRTGLQPWRWSLLERLKDLKRSESGKMMKDWTNSQMLTIYSHIANRLIALFAIVLRKKRMAVWRRKVIYCDTLWYIVVMMMTTMMVIWLWLLDITRWLLDDDDDHHDDHDDDDDDDDDDGWWQRRWRRGWSTMTMTMTMMTIIVYYCLTCYQYDDYFYCYYILVYHYKYHQYLSYVTFYYYILHIHRHRWHIMIQHTSYYVMIAACPGLL